MRQPGAPPDVPTVEVRCFDKKDGNQTVWQVDLYIGKKLICRSKILVSDVRTMQPLADALLELLRQEKKKGSKIIPATNGKIVIPQVF